MLEFAEGLATPEDLLNQGASAAESENDALIKAALEKMPNFSNEI